MSISVRSRKLLWGKSGNRCALCRQELVKETNNQEKFLNIGEECHIISGASDGPRHNPDYGNYDEYANLILLCCNHHTEIDFNIELYTKEFLMLLKKSHEQWVQSTLNKSSELEKEKLPKVQIYPRVRSGKQLVNTINSIHGLHIDHSDLNTEEEVDFISSFSEELSDWTDLSGMGAISKGDEIKFGFELSEKIKKIEQLGFYIFANSEMVRMTNESKLDLGVFGLSTILIYRKVSPGIFGEDFLLGIKSTDFKFTF
ncbi:MAG TPA: hypothetical protein VK177_21220 [Flavobacteriales bacterium]|nr:hypothetical protein [Flavobacteriales bacterium]